VNIRKSAGKLLWSFLIICAIGLLITSIYRAVNFPFTHDESLSYAGFTWQRMWKDTANNHLLNTFLMAICAKYFGTSELSLRLPNILAHMLYLLSSLLIIKRIKTTLIRLLVFSLLNLNPFVLNFFFLARGYGLAMGFQLVSLLLIIRAFEMKNARNHELVIFSAAFAGGLSTLASFTFLYFYLPTLITCFWLIVRGSSLRQLKLRNFENMSFLVISNGLLLEFILTKIFKLQKEGELYFGGTTGFIKDTLNSLVRGTLYRSIDNDALVNAISISAIVIFFIMIVLEISRLIRMGDITLLSVLLFILTSTIIIPIIQHLILKTPFPIERSALYYLPLFGLSLSFSLNSVNGLEIKNPLVVISKIFSILSLGAVVLLYIRTFSLDSCYDWEFDKYNKQVIQVIDRDRQISFPDQMISVGISWVFEPSLNFYRITKHYDWLNEVTRKGIDLAEDNYIYAYEDDVIGLDSSDYTLLESFPEIQTVLLRVTK